VQLTLISDPRLKMPADEVAALKAQDIAVTETSELADVLGDLDVLYVTRVQAERFKNREEYEAVRGGYEITPQTLEKAKDDMILLHPLPRVGEIHPDVDDDSRATYFKQAENGLYVRMALLCTVLGESLT